MHIHSPDAAATQGVYPTAQSSCSGTVPTGTSCLITSQILNVSAQRRWTWSSFLTLDWFS